MKDLSTVFKALADETRLAMMALLLRHDELCVCDFVEVMNISQSKASRHLRYLLHAGLLEDRRDAVWVHYRIRPRPGVEVRDVLCSVGPLIASRPLAGLEQRLARWLADKRRGAASCVPPPKPKRSATSKSAAPGRRRVRGRRAKAARTRSGCQETSA